MNVYIFKYPLVFVLLMVGSGLTAHGQNFKFLVPKEAIVQYAGSIGYFSAGAGYEIFGNKRGNLSFHYGYVPESKGGELHITTVKLAYKPWKVALKDWGAFYPFNPGFFASYTFHKDLEVFFPSGQYPKDYYYWSEAIRPHLSFNSEIELEAPKVFKSRGIRALGLYIEANTNDYYLINYLQNTSELNINDIFQLGLGLRVKF